LQTFRIRDTLKSTTATFGSRGFRPVHPACC